MNHLAEVKALRSRTDVHFNCAQSLLCPFAKEIGLSSEKAQALGAFFGAGMMHGSTCGALSSTLMILGMMGVEREAAMKQIEEFRKRHQVTACAQLLTCAREKGIEKKHHCDALVYEMCAILDEMLAAKA